MLLYITLCFQSQLQIVSILFGEIVGLAAAVAGTMLGLHTYASRTTVVGILATAFGICMYGSPLTIMVCTKA